MEAPLHGAKFNVHIFLYMYSPTLAQICIGRISRFFPLFLFFICIIYHETRSRHQKKIQHRIHQIYIHIL